VNRSLLDVGRSAMPARLRALRADITMLSVEAIVNAANLPLLDGEW
jgi:O-acetyl-ADP-ribose deacetylase (regulator of RNase III)